MRLSFFLFFCSSLLESQQTGNCFLSAQVIKFKLCRCMKKKHKGHNNNDRGAVLSLDDVKRHVSRLTPSPPLMSHLLQQEGCTLTPAAGKESGGGWSVNRVRARQGGGGGRAGKAEKKTVGGKVKLRGGGWDLIKAAGTGWKWSPRRCDGSLNSECKWSQFTLIVRLHPGGGKCGQDVSLPLILFPGKLAALLIHPLSFSFHQYFHPFSSLRLQGCFVFFLLSLSRSTPRSACSSCRVSVYFPELDLVRCSPTPFLRFCDDSLPSLPPTPPLPLPPPLLLFPRVSTSKEFSWLRHSYALSYRVALKSKSASNCRWTVNHVSSFSMWR